jgi:hypothetical protein
VEVAVVFTSMMRERCWTTLMLAGFVNTSPPVASSVCVPVVVSTAMILPAAVVESTT